MISLFLCDVDNFVILFFLFWLEWWHCFRIVSYVWTSWVRSWLIFWRFYRWFYRVRFLFRFLLIWIWLCFLFLLWLSLSIFFDRSTWMRKILVRFIFIRWFLWLLNRLFRSLRFLCESRFNERALSCWKFLNASVL